MLLSGTQNELFDLLVTAIGGLKHLSCLSCLKELRKMRSLKLEIHTGPALLQLQNGGSFKLKISVFPCKMDSQLSGNSQQFLMVPKNSQLYKLAVSKKAWNSSEFLRTKEISSVQAWNSQQFQALRVNQLQFKKLGILGNF